MGTMQMANFKIAAKSVILLLVVAVILCQEQRANRLKTEVLDLREEVARLTASEQSEALSKPRADSEQSVNQDQFMELLRLRGQVAVLRADLAEATNRALTGAPSRQDELWAGEPVVERYKTALEQFESKTAPSPQDEEAAIEAYKNFIEQPDQEHLPKATNP
jgi:hypothetical protein